MTVAKAAPSDYTLVRLREQDAIDQTRVHNAAAWKTPLSTQDYVAREALLGRCPMTRDLYVFALQRLALAEFVSLVEICLRPAVKYRKGPHGVEKRTVASAVIGAVYTYEPHRGAGLAAIMMDKLVAELPRHIGGDGLVFLYSEIGDYYARNGFHAVPVPLLSVPVARGSEPVDAQMQLLKFGDFAPLMDTYRAHADRLWLSRVAVDGRTRVALEPSAHMVDWFHLRANFVQLRLFGSTGLPDVRSEPYEALVAQLPNDMCFGLRWELPSSVAFIVWTIDFTSRKTAKATVIKLHVDAAEDYEPRALALVENMRRYLAAFAPCCVEKIVLWELEAPLLCSHLVKKYRAERGLENGSRSAAMLMDAAEDAQFRRGDLVWEENTKLPWF